MAVIAAIAQSLGQSLRDDVVRQQHALRARCSMRSTVPETDRVAALLRVSGFTCASGIEGLDQYTGPFGYGHAGIGGVRCRGRQREIVALPALLGVDGTGEQLIGYGIAQLRDERHATSLRSVGLDILGGRFLGRVDIEIGDRRRYPQDVIAILIDDLVAALGEIVRELLLKGTCQVGFDLLHILVRYPAL